MEPAPQELRHFTKCKRYLNEEGNPKLNHSEKPLHTYWDGYLKHTHNKPSVGKGVDRLDPLGTAVRMRNGAAVTEELLRGSSKR